MLYGGHRVLTIMTRNNEKKIKLMIENLRLGLLRHDPIKRILV